MFKMGLSCQHEEWEIEACSEDYCIYKCKYCQKRKLVKRTEITKWEGEFE